LQVRKKNIFPPEKKIKLLIIKSRYEGKKEGDRRK